MRAAVAAALVVALIAAAPAAAQTTQPEPGVYIDPQSPSSKEYDIPLEGARRGADPGTDPRSPVGQGQRVAPLFGAGITAATGGSGSGSGDRAGSGGERDNGGGHDSRGATGGAGDPPAAVVKAAANPARPDGGGMSLAIVGIALAVLLAGSATGWLLRRRGS